MTRKWKCVGVVSLVLCLFPLVALAGGYSVRNLRGLNDPGSPAYRYTVSADLVEFWNPIDGTSLVSSPMTAVTCDTATYGRNGRDQSAALPSVAWVRFYATRSSSQSPACLMSLSAPPAGPTLQGGDTHWAYLGTIRWVGGFSPTRMLGSWMKHEEFLNILSNGSATVETEVLIDFAVPPEASEWEGQPSYYLTTASSGPYPGVMCFTLFQGYLPGKVHRSNFTCLNGLTPGAAQLLEGYVPRMPNWNQRFWYRWDIYQGTGPQFSVDLYGYKVPNGGE